MGRKTFTSRPCKRCGEIWPFSEYQRPIRTMPAGFVLTTMCRSCYRQYQSEYKKRQYVDMVGREKLLERHRQYRQQMPPEVDRRQCNNRSRLKWTYYRCESYLDQMPSSIIVYLVPLDGRKCDGPDRPDRPWRYKTWAVRDERPGITPPKHSVPIMRINGTSVAIHTMCPDEWRWVAKYTAHWLRRRYVQEVE